MNAMNAACMKMDLYVKNMKNKIITFTLLLYLLERVLIVKLTIFLCPVLATQILQYFA